MITTTEVITVNGVVLNTLAKNVETLAKTLRVPSRRGGLVAVAGRHGALPSNRTYYDAQLMAWPMWVAGCNDDGQVPQGTTARRLFYQNLEALVRLFAAPTLDIRHTLPDGSVRQIFGRVQSTIDFTTSGTNPLGKFSVEIVCADPFWQDVDPTTQSFGMGSGAATLTLASFAAASAPMGNMVIDFVGPMNNPKITDPITGSWFQYNEVLAATKGVKVDCNTWKITGIGGQVVDYSKAVYAGGGRFYEVQPPVTGAPTVQFTSSGGTGGTLTFTGRRKYLVG